MDILLSISSACSFSKCPPEQLLLLSWNNKRPRMKYLWVFWLAVMLKCKETEPLHLKLGGAGGFKSLIHFMAAKQNLTAGTILTDAPPRSLCWGNWTPGASIHPGSHTGTSGCLIWNCDKEALSTGSDMVVSNEHFLCSQQFSEVFLQINLHANIL